jgi:probable HAF family extracellular repeat protein
MWRTILGSLLVLFGLASPGQASFMFTQLDVPSAMFTVAQGINRAGQIVGTFQDASGSTHGFLTADRGATFTQLDVPSATSTGAFGINDAGQIVGSFTELGFFSHGFLITDGGRPSRRSTSPSVLSPGSTTPARSWEATPIRAARSTGS